MRITKVLHSNYSILDNFVLQSKKLSFKAKGLYAFLVSVPNDFKLDSFTLQKLTNSKENAQDLKEALKELEKFNLVSFKTFKDKQGNKQKMLIITEFNTKD